MSTITTKVVKNNLVITSPVSAKESSTKKSVVIATTNGFLDTGVKYKGKSIMLNLNAFVPHKPATKEHEPAKGVSAKIENMALTMSIPLDEHDSQSGKSTVIATTHGNRSCGLKIAEKDLMIGVTAYIGK